MIDLTLDHAWTHVSGTTEELQWLHDFAAYETRKYIRRTNSYAFKRTSLYNPMDRMLPTGLVPNLLRLAGKHGKHIRVIVDNRTAPQRALFDTSWMREYQKEALKRALERAHGLLWLPTGAGKTEIACALMARVPEPWVFMVHRTQLAQQAAARFAKRTGEQAGVIGEGQWNTARVTCATFQSLHKRWAKGGEALLRSARGIIVDEAHTMPADTFWRLGMATSAAYYRIGLSATPLARGDKRSLRTIAVLGPVIFRVLPEELIRAGYVSRPRIRMVAHEQHETVRRTKSQWAKSYNELVVNSPSRNGLIVRMALASAAPRMVFVRNLKHVRILARLLTRAGLNVRAVDGNDKTPSRLRDIAALQRGDIDTIVCSSVFQVGIDVPELRTVINAAGRKSVIETVQRLGRGMRACAGKSTFELWDVLDTGSPWATRHAKVRRKAYEREGHDVEVLNSV